MKSFIFKTLIANRIHERVRGGFRIAKFLVRDMDSVPIQIDGYAPLYVDLRNLDAHALSLHLAAPLHEVPHEQALTEVFQRIVQPSDTVFDVGANLGLHTLTFSKLAREVIAFEPNPSLAPNLRKTVVNLPNARLLEVCLSEHDGIVEFHISDWDHMLGSMANWTGQPTKTLAIPARSIDSLIAEGALPKPQVLKVDVEGAEMMVFRGADKLFSEPDAPRAVVFEELNTASRKLGVPDGAPAEYLRTKGYSLYLIDKDGLSPLSDVRPTAANLVAAKDDLIGLTRPFNFT
ncbi:MAG: FkbM family methyltransferase [Pyrinomonadaceae bacterium]